MAPVRSESRGEVAAGINTVFAYISDVARWPEWADEIRECSVSGGADLRPGARIDQRVGRAGGTTKERVLDVVGVEAPSRLEFAGMYGPSPLKWGFDLQPVEDRRTEIAIWVEMDRRGPMRAMPAPVLRSGIGKTNDQEIARIRARIESEGGDQGSRPVA